MACCPSIVLVLGAQGNAGLQGAQGSGGDGTQGLSGEAGVQGFRGIQGPCCALPGTQGLSGLQGNGGTQGFQGILGAQGAIGLGQQGLSGLQGLTGVQGSGLQGAAGLQGLSGTQGNGGVQGLVGVQGVEGIGNQGVSGLQGADGVQGGEGIQGPEGTQGLEGVQGVDGVQGLSGLQGVDGVQGVEGLQGLQGLAGTQGLQGPCCASPQGLAAFGNLFNIYPQVIQSGTYNQGDISNRVKFPLSGPSVGVSFDMSTPYGQPEYHSIVIDQPGTYWFFWQLTFADPADPVFDWGPDGLQGGVQGQGAPRTNASVSFPEPRFFALFDADLNSGIPTNPGFTFVLPTGSSQLQGQATYTIAGGPLPRHIILANTTETGTGNNFPVTLAAGTDAFGDPIVGASITVIRFM